MLLGLPNCKEIPKLSTCMFSTDEDEGAVFFQPGTNSGSYAD